MEMKPNEWHWFELICQCRASGLTDKQWCLENGISASTLYRYARKLSQLSCEIPPGSRTRKIPVHQEVVAIQLTDDTPENPPASTAGSPNIPSYKNSLQAKQPVLESSPAVPGSFTAAARLVTPDGAVMEISDRAIHAVVTSIMHSLHGLC